MKTCFKIIWILLVCCGLFAPYQLHAQSEIQTTIKTLTSRVKAMAEMAGNTNDPVEAYRLVAQIDSLLAAAETLINTLDASLEQQERLAQEFKQKAQAANAEPQKANAYRQKAAEILEQTDLLFILQQELTEALAALRDRSEELKSQPLVAYLFAVDQQTYETEVQNTLDEITATVEAAEKTAAPEQRQQLLTRAKGTSEALEEKRKQAKALAADCQQKAEQYQADPEKARLYTQTALKLEQHEERLFVLQQKLKQAIIALEDK